MSSQVIFWLVVLIVLVVAELLTMGLTTIWFAGGAIVAAIIACFTDLLWVQLIFFVVVSVALLIITRPLAVKHFNKERMLTNAESLVGQRAVVLSDIDNLRGIGQVSVKGQEWSARSQEDGYVIPKGAIVTILAISGVKLIVEVDESMKDSVPLMRSEGELDPRVIEEKSEDGIDNDDLGSLKF